MRTLFASGLDVDVLPCSSDPKPDAYDAVVVGSAIYVRRWDKAASSYLKQYAPVLADANTSAGRPCWICAASMFEPPKE